jgi:hypothetical protein
MPVSFSLLPLQLLALGINMFSILSLLLSVFRQAQRLLLRAERVERLNYPLLGQYFVIPLIQSHRLHSNSGDRVRHHICFVHFPMCEHYRPWDLFIIPPQSWVCFKIVISRSFYNHSIHQFAYPCIFFLFGIHSIHAILACNLYLEQALSAHGISSERF